MFCPKCTPCSLEYWTVADRLPRSFKGPFFIKVFFLHPHHLLPGRTTFHVLNSIKLCCWPISLAMSSGKYLTNASSCLPVPGGLWLQGTLQLQNCEVRIITCKFLTMQQPQRDSEEQSRERHTLSINMPLFFYDILQWLQSKLQANRYWLNSWLNQTLSMLNDYQDNNTNAVSPCRVRGRPQRESICRWSGNDLRTQVH